jgi:hypothetical protein
MKERTVLMNMRVHARIVPGLDGLPILPAPPLASPEHNAPHPSIAPPALVHERVFEDLALDQALRRYVAELTGAAGARLDALLRRLGWGDQPACTLREAGEAIGVTKQRMRQMELSLKKRASRHPVTFPALERALALLRDAPLDALEAARKLQSERVTTIPFLPANVLAAAQLFGRIHPIQAEAFDEERDHALKRRSALLAVAKTIATRGGLVTAAQIASACELEPACTEPEVRELLSGSLELVFLADDWYWLASCGARSNRLLRSIRGMLAVSPALELPTLHAGLKRRFSGFALPPLYVLKELLRVHPEFKLHGSLVTSTERLAPERELDVVERVLLEVLGRGRSLPIAELENACRAHGLRRDVVRTAAMTSCILERYSAGLFRLRGVPLL